MDWGRLCRHLLVLFILVILVWAEGPAVTSLNYHVKSYQTLDEQNELAVITGKLIHLDQHRV